MLGRATSNSDTQDSPRPELGGNHHLPPYNIFCSSPQGPHTNGFLSRDSQVGVPKFPHLGLPRLWKRITSRVNLRLQWHLKKNCSPCRKLFNNMSHVACTQWNWVKNQTVNLTPNFSFGHNLCFRCPNGQCKPILDIYVLIAFEWYKKLFEEMGFDPWNCTLKIWESIWEFTWECEGSFPHILYTHGSMWCDSWISLLACNLATLCLGRKSKVRVTTLMVMWGYTLIYTPLGI